MGPEAICFQVVRSSVRASGRLHSPTCLPSTSIFKTPYLREALVEMGKTVVDVCRIDAGCYCGY